MSLASFFLSKIKQNEQQGRTLVDFSHLNSVKWQIIIFFSARQVKLERVWKETYKVFIRDGKISVCFPPGRNDHL